MQKIILGIDEVGRGPYAGPLVIGACILPTDRENHPWINELNDSKKFNTDTFSIFSSTFLYNEKSFTIIDNLYVCRPCKCFHRN